MSKDQFSFDRLLSVIVLHFLEAGAAVYRSVVRRLEDHLCFAAALCASGGEVLTGSSACVLLCVTASLAALGLILEALFLVESLLAGGENKFVSAILAYQSFVNEFLVNSYDFYVFVHDVKPRFVVLFFAVGS
jgi:hypothetical protein